MKKLYHYPALNRTFVRFIKYKGFSLLFVLLFFSGFGFRTHSQEMFVETLTSTGTWTVPEGVTEITVEAWGAGGGGGGSESNNRGGSGGGGGGYTINTFTVTPEQSIPYTVGEGGTGGAADGGNGGDGGQTSFLSLDAYGGTGGGGNGGTIGTGGTASGGHENLGGQDGSQGGNSGGNGGQGAKGGAGGLGRTDNAGLPGTSPGGGGGGGERFTGYIFGIGASDYPGGQGANGQIRISYIPPYRADFIAMDTGSNIWETGETRTVSVTITNTGQATWTNAGPDINIGVKWNAESDYMIRVDANDLAPGQTRTYELTVGAPMAIGTNNLTFDVVNEGACWFGNNSGKCGPGNSVFQSPEITIAPVVNRYYSYQSGDWNDPSTWTQDPSGSLSVNPTVPGAYDFVTILNGRSVYIPNNNKSVYALEIQNGGSLDLRTSTGHNFGAVSGEGTLRLQVNGFPGGDFSAFTSVGGGTVEYYNPSADFSLQRLEYNNLTFNFSNSNRRVTLAGNLTVNGNLNVNRGVFQIGNSGTARIVQVGGNVLVDNNGRIGLGTGNANHRFVVKGDFANYGVVRFTNQNETFNNNYYTSTPNDGRADVVFNNPMADQSLYLAGQSDFYRIEIDKGVDQTYVLNIDAAAPENFRLFGRNNQVPGTDAPNIYNPHALGLQAGTVRLGQNVLIPSLATGTTYTVDEDAMLWLDGANVTFGTGTPGDGTTLLLYGALKVSGTSVLNDNSKQGIVSRNNASIIFEGGEISTECVRTSYQSGTHRGAFNMSGGELTVRGANLPNLGGMNVYAAFTLPYPDNTMDISGGVINILSPNPLGGGSGSNFSLLIGANPNNVSITGGEINVTVPDNRNAYMLSTAPLWDLNIYSNVTNRSAQPLAYANNTTIPGLAVQPLVVKNTLTLNNRAVLTSGNANANVVVGGDFTINSNTTYSPGSNTTIFNGNGPQSFTNNGALTNGFNNLELAGKSDLTIDGAATLAIRGSLTLGKETILRDNGRTVTVNGNIQNSGTHFRPVTGAGRIELTGNGNQILSGDGNGQFNNLSVNKNGGSVTTDASTAVNGDLRLVSNHRFSIGNNLLKLGPDANVYSAATGTAQAFSNNKMIVTGGLMSNGGVQKEFNNTNGFLFPFGFAVGATHYYMPATLRFSSTPTKWGAVTSRPVHGRHHLAQGNNNGLGAYWKTTSQGFEGIPSSSVVHTYAYVDAFVSGNENNYIPSVYNYGTAWRTINDVNLVNQATNVITFNAESNANGDFTAGLPSAFEGIPVLYSRTSGNWNVAATWSATSHTGDPGSALPTGNTIVVIGEGHTVTMTANNAQAGALFISDGATLDLVRTNGHNFAALPEESVTGSGTLRIARTYFPRGDFGEFLGENGGTVEYYVSGGNAYTLPTVSDGTSLPLTHYRNLIINASGANITLPNIDFAVSENLVVKGTNQVRTNTGGVRTYRVGGNMVIESGNLVYRNDRVTHFIVSGDVVIHPGAYFTVREGGTAVANTLEIEGSLINNGTFNMVGGTRNTATIFKGEQDAVIEGSGSSFNFHSLTVDKGSDVTPVLTLKSSITTGVSNPFLTLLNGTFRVDGEGLVVTVTDGSTSFSIPSTAALSVNAGTVRVAYGNNTANLLLAGRLEVLGGRMEIGQSSRDRNNSIEYAAAGKPEVYVSGGTLYVNGQIRRPATTTSGSLNFIQSGGEVIIAGRNRMVARGLLEVANNGSLFKVSGGQLILARPSALGSAFGDLYLRPEINEVSGGTIQLGDDGNTAGYSFDLQLGTPIWSLQVGANTGQSASLAVLPLVVKNELLISSNSVFLANGLDVNLEGRLVNNNISASRGINEGGFRPGAVSQTTRFNGTGSQQIQGFGTNVTNFANLEFRGTSLSLAGNSSLYVNNNLSLYSGVFNDGGNIIAVARNIYNVARHESPSAMGGISVEGTQAQTISGNNAVFGNVLMNNSNGANVVNNIRINGHLVFTAGSLYIDDYLLTFGENAVVGGTPGRKQMVMLNGVLSDQGVRKLYAAGAAGEFVFPIGVHGKYTPASYTVLANGAPGSITLRTINEKHAAVNDADDNELAYYWSVKSEGFSGLSVSHRYTYEQDDVRADEAQYVGGRYDYENYTWYNLGEVVDAANNAISFSGDYITGEYTAGYAPNFVTKPVLYSRGDGSWDGTTTWATSPGGAASGLTPDGNPVVIAEGHYVTLNVDNAYTYSVELNGTLDIGTTLYHNMGHFFGNGTLAVGSTSDGNFILPGGKFDEFFDNAASTIEFKGNNEANLPLKPGNIYKPFQNVVLSGTGRKNISADDMKINGNLIIRNGTVLSNVNNNRTLYVGGDWINENASVGGFLAGRGTVVFDGNRIQQFKVKADESFYNVTMNTNGELDMAETAVGANFVVSNRLNLSRGIIRSYADKVVYISNTANNAVAGGNVNSFVDGPMTKRMLTGQSFNFQVGNDGRYGRMAVLNTQGGSSPADWTVRYLNANDLPKEEENLNTPITSVSNNERWEVSRPTGARANIQLRWDEQSYPGVTSDALLRNSLRVVQFNNSDSKWTERGQTVNASTKTVATSTRVTTNDYVFTLGLSGVTATISDFTPVEICNNGTVASIPVVLSGSAPWTLSYRVTGASSTRNFTQTGITSPNYVIQLTGDDLAGAGSYSVSLVSVSDQSAVGIANGGSVNLLVQETSVPVITGAALVGLNEVRSYSTPQNGANTYVWSWVGTSGGIIANSNAAATNITFGNSTGTYQLQLTETTAATGCEITTVFTVEITNIPVPDIAPDEPNICAGTTVTYSTAAITGNQYKWTVIGGTVQTSGADNWRTVAGGGNSITVLWGAAGNGSVKVEERVGTTSVQGETTLDVVVSPAVNARTVAIQDTEVCDGGSTFVRVVNSELNVSYRLKNTADGTYMGPSVGGNGSDLLLPTGALYASEAPYQIVVEAFNLACSMDITAGTVNVLPALTVELSSDAAGNAFCVGTAVSFSATPGYSQYVFVVDGTAFDNGNQAVFTTNALVDGSEVSVQALAANGCWGESETLSMQTANIAGMWTGIADSDWDNPMNWCDGQVPVSNSNLVISSKMVHQPVVEDDLTFDNLTIEPEASMVLEGGTRVDMTGLFRNDGELVLNNSYSLNGLVSLIQHGSTEGDGQTRIQLKLPVNEWYYVSHPVKNAKSGVYDVFMPGEDLTNNDFRDYSHVAFHRNNKWYRVTGANVALWNLEGMSVKYTPSVGDEHTLNYTGELNDEPISRSYDKGGFYLFGNPYSSYIDWQTTEGWGRPELSGTIWYRTRVREEMGFVTYNRDAPVYEARVAVYPDGVEVGNEEEIALIPPYQSVWVRAWQPTTLSVSPVVRRHGLENSFLKSGRIDEPQVDVIRVISENSRSYDATVLYFYEHSTEEEDLGDSEKRFNETDQIPEVYTKVGSKAMAINGLPSLSSPTYSIPLGVKNQVAGSVSLRVELKHFDAAYSVYLEDKETGAFLRVNREADYVYSSRAQGLVDDRFVLHLLKVTTSTGEQEWQAGDEQGISIKSVGGKALVTIADELLSYENAKVEVYTIEGRKVSETIVKNSRTLVVLPNMGGSFLIRASAGPVIRTGIALGSNR